MLPQVHTGLVVVDCAPLKAALASKAATLVHAVLQHLAGQCSALSLHICSRCSHISERVAMVSADTREVLALQVRCCGMMHTHLNQGTCM
jgi:hypothetical protein